MRGVAFWGLKNPRSPRVPGALPPGPPTGTLEWGPWTPRRAHSALTIWSKTILIQPPPHSDTSPAHAPLYARNEGMNSLKNPYI